MIKVDDVAYARVNVDTIPDKDGWCFCTPWSPQEDVDKGLVSPLESQYQIFAQVFKEIPNESADRA